MAEVRDSMVRQWADWLGDRMTAANSVPRHTVERELRLLIDVMTEMVGPMRRDVKKIWYACCEHYGRVAAARGLAAGEVVEEMQFLREMLIRNLSAVIAAMRARQGMAIMLRLNRVLDKGIAVAVVGYTDALVATLFAQNGVPRRESDLVPSDIERQLEGIELDLAQTTGKANRGLPNPVSTETGSV